MTGASRLESPLVAVVDDDESVRESLPDLLHALGFSACAFASAAEFLSFEFIHQTRCLVLDVAMPSMTGPELQRELIVRGHEIPVVFITAHAGGTLRPMLVAAGVGACLFKPFSDTDLLVAIESALGES